MMGRDTSSDEPACGSSLPTEPELTEALDDSFPCSDPPAWTTPCVRTVPAITGPKVIRLNLARASPTQRK